jgi:hypothetical protein
VRIIFSKAAKLQNCLFRMLSDSRHDVEGGHIPKQETSGPSGSSFEEEWDVTTLYPEIITSNDW